MRKDDTPTMSIYTRFGRAVTLCDARLIPVWVEKSRSEIKWHYEQPAKLRKGSKLEERPIWHYRGWYTENGQPVCDNKWVSAHSLRADDGWTEIEAKLFDLCPDGEEKYDAWNKTGAPEASTFFPPITASEAA